MRKNKYKKTVHKWVSQYKDGYWDPFKILARLFEEGGELSREINHKYGPKKKKPGEKAGSIEEEIGDILFTIICMANSQNIDIDKAFEYAMHKAYNRDANRFEKL